LAAATDLDLLLIGPGFDTIFSVRAGVHALDLQLGKTGAYGQIPRTK
jgi:hypothetical protein